MISHKRTFDLVVLGSGSAALSVAHACRAAGWKVAAVDRRPFGGTCALRGCDPKRVMMAAGEAYDLAARLQGKGLAGQLVFDWPALLRFKRSFTDPVPEAREAALREAGIEIYHGTARFLDHQTLLAEGRKLVAGAILIATGAEPARLGIPGEDQLTFSDEFLELDCLPKRIVMVGGGYIAAEFASLAAHAGARPTIVQRGSRILEGFDPDLVGWLSKRLESAGAEIRLDTTVGGIERTGSGFAVHLNPVGRPPETVEADLVLHAAGRVPSLAALDLEAGGVALEQGRLKLNAYLQSCSNPIVYAAGDAAGRRPALTPVAADDARIVTDNLLHGNRREAANRVIPSVAFTIPPIASVGLSEEEARKTEARISVRCEQTSSWYSARRTAEPVYGYKVILDEDERILGAHLVGPSAEEVINIFSMGIAHRLTRSEIESIFFAYPTGASDIRYMLG